MLLKLGLTLPIGLAIALPLALPLRLPAQDTSSAPPPDASRRPAVRDSTPVDPSRPGAARRLAATPEVLRTAFRDAESREMVARARHARFAMDSSIRSYEANVRERLTMHLAVGGEGRERMFWRQESASRVRWREDVGAHVELVGWRVGRPGMPASSDREHMRHGVTNNSMTTIPYFPGREALWIGGQPTVQREIDDREYVHPLADGAEAYYTYASGDSLSWRLPSGQTLRLREIRFRPRFERWNLAVGSIWFDAQSGQVVRAAYRLSGPRDILMNAAVEASSLRQRAAVAAIKSIASPMVVQINSITVEYGLYEGRYWLPRSRALHGTQRMSFLRAPVTMEQLFAYTSVNAGESIPEFAINAPEWIRLRAPDSLDAGQARRWLDSALAERRKLRRAFRDSVLTAPCDSTGYRTLARERFETRTPVAVRYPCEIERLAESEAFADAPLYAENEELFDAASREALARSAITLGAQALGEKLPRPRSEYGLPLTRYNRVEGLSTGLRLEQRLGRGYSVAGLARIGTADRHPTGELTLARSDFTRTVAMTAYDRLVASSEWGNPLSFGSSVSALLFGRDEAFYHRAAGAELEWRNDGSTGLDWRLFVERQRAAEQRTSWSMTGDFAPNIEAERGVFTGASVQWRHTRGADPRGFRLRSEVRLEAATGASDYGRGAAELTLASGFADRLGGALTLAGGTSAGRLPVQRRWYLGGTHTVRGQLPDTARSGDTFWLTRAEAGVDLPFVRPVLFGDLGWVGERSVLATGVRPMSGAGAGVSVLDGLVRLDLARGISPVRRTAVIVYLDGRF